MFFFFKKNIYIYNLNFILFFFFKKKNLKKAKKIYKKKNKRKKFNKEYKKILWIYDLFIITNNYFLYFRLFYFRLINFNKYK